MAEDARSRLPRRVLRVRQGIPPPERRRHRALWAGRRGDPHGERPDPGLLAIGVEDVLEALAGLPRVPPRAASAGDGTRASTFAGTPLG